jgi:hypothetical protein
LLVECDGVLPVHAFDFGVRLEFDEFIPAHSIGSADGSRVPAVLPIVLMPHWTGIRLTCPSHINARDIKVYCVQLLEKATRDALVQRRMQLPVSGDGSLFIPDATALFDRWVHEPIARKRAKCRHDAIFEELMAYVWSPERIRNRLSLIDDYVEENN